MLLIFEVHGASYWLDAPWSSEDGSWLGILHNRASLWLTSLRSNFRIIPLFVLLFDQLVSLCLFPFLLLKGFLFLHLLSFLLSILPICQISIHQILYLFLLQKIRQPIFTYKFLTLFIHFLRFQLSLASYFTERSPVKVFLCCMSLKLSHVRILRFMVGIPCRREIVQGVAVCQGGHVGGWEVIFVGFFGFVGAHAEAGLLFVIFGFGVVFG